jgi:hypothetical protein
VVRGTEWPRGQERLARRDEPQGTVDAGRFDRFGGCERRQDRGDALGEHCLAAAGRPDHGHIVAAGRGDADGPFGSLLPAHIGEVDVVMSEPLEPLADPRGRRVDLQIARKEADSLGERGHGNDLHVFHHGRLGGTRRRHDDAPQIFLPRGCDCHRERPPGRSREALERELAHHGVVVETFRGKLPAAGENAERDRQVERGGLLGDFRRGKIHDDPVVRAVEPRIDHGAGHAVGALADGCVRQADQHRGRQRPGRDVDLDFDRHGIDPEHRKSLQAGEHGTVLSGR